MKEDSLNKRRIKVMHVLNTGGYSGAENVVVTMINKMKYKVESVYVSPKGKICDVLRENNISFLPLKGEMISKKELKKAIDNVKPDIIHSHDFTAGIVTAYIAGRIPIINHLHNNSPWIKNMCLKSVVYGMSCFRYNKILTVSEAVMNEYIFGKYFKKKTKVIGNPIDLQKIRDKALEVPDFGKTIEQTDMAFLGRLVAEKNIFFLLDIIKDLAQKKPNLSVAIIGDGELRKEFEKKIEEYGLEDNILIYGFQKNPYIYIKATKVLCMPSKWEGFGLAAVEGLALGKPVVAAPVGGLGEIVNEKCGKLCKNKGEYVREIYKLLDETWYYQKKKEEALKRARKYDNIEQYMDDIMGVYQAILSD